MAKSRPSDTPGRISNQSKQRPISVAFSVDEFPPAPLVGFADRCMITRTEDVFELAFFPPGSDVCIARGIVFLDDFMNRLWGTSSEFFDQISSWLGDTIHHLPKLSTGLSAGAATPVVCNVFNIAHTGLGAAMDCYYLSPHTVHHLRIAEGKNQDPHVALRPVFSVQMRLTLLASILAYARDVTHSIKKSSVPSR